jgi:hypothetical protein
MSTAIGAIGLSFNLLIRHVIALLYCYRLAIVVVAIVGETTTWRQGDGDHGVKPVTMEIMPAPQDGDQKARSDDGHIMSLI